MTGDDVLAVIRDALARVLGVDPAAVTRDTAFREDLDADSLALVELAEVVEERLRPYAGRRLRYDDEDLDRMRTVGEAVDYALARL